MKISDTQTAYGINAGPNADGSYDPRYAGPEAPAQTPGDILVRMSNYIHGEHDDYVPDVLAEAMAEISKLRAATFPAVQAASSETAALTLIREYIRDLRRNSSGGDDYPWEIMRGVADYLEILIERSRAAVQAVGTQIARETVTIYVPDGYRSADEFLLDCGFEQASPQRPHLSTETCNCLMCLAEGENSPHRRRAALRDRPAKNPGGMQCEKCDEIFIGEEWHSLCAVCGKIAR